ncbi:YceI family protein [Flammeovirga aprica]|uniref:YceI family protein n=1 Tax=Flammeovirga aprica JL-4 TaxID=694437 RepID=A0A7X9S0L1_9BACT|nr:YceI family protein [Flammeovirga aprica]NME72181.1 YceI family protein [Flammeovirga aprica JL-4]
MTKLVNYLIGALLISAIGCSSPSKSNESSSTTSNEKEVQSEAKYSYDPNGTVVSFTAFKTTDKVGVGGKFLKFDVTPKTAEVSNAIDILPGLTFSIPVNSVETNDVGRNAKIVEHFFGTLLNNETIKGEVKSVSNGKATVSLTMNDITKDVELVAKADKNVVVLKGSIDMATWNGLDAINALNKICYDLHKGADGQSKLWSDVELFVKAKLAQ